MRYILLLLLAISSTFCSDLTQLFQSRDLKSLKHGLKEKRPWDAYDKSLAFWLNHEDVDANLPVALEEVFDFYAFESDKFLNWAKVSYQICLQLESSEENSDYCIESWLQKLREYAKREPALNFLRTQIKELDSLGMQSMAAQFLFFSLQEGPLHFNDSVGFLSLTARGGDLDSRVLLTNHYLKSGNSIQALAWIYAAFQEGLSIQEDMAKEWDRQREQLEKTLSSTEVQSAKAMKILAHSFDYAKSNALFSQSSGFKSQKEDEKTEKNLSPTSVSSKDSVVNKSAFEACFAHQIELQAAMRLYRLRNPHQLPETIQDLVQEGLLTNLPKHQDIEKKNLYHLSGKTVFCELHGPYDASCDEEKNVALCKASKLRQEMLLKRD